MAIKTREEILASLRDRIGDDTSDETLAFVADITDTLTDMETRASGQTDWKKKYEDNDAEWRQKYRDRFFSAPDERGGVDPRPIETRTKTFEELFKEE